MGKESSTKGKELELALLSLLGDEEILKASEYGKFGDMLQEPTTSKGLYYNDMNFCEIIERVYLDSWDFLMGLKSCFSFSGVMISWILQKFTR